MRSHIALHSFDYVFRRTVDMQRRYRALLESGEPLPDRERIEQEYYRCTDYIRNHQFQFQANLLRFELSKGEWGGETGY